MKKLKVFIIILILAISPCVFAACKQSPENENNYTYGLTYSLNNDGKSYRVSGIGSVICSNIIIPPSYNTLPIVSIEDGSFENYEFIKSVILPDSITQIGNNAFKNCINLENIGFSKNLEDIGDNAFRNCTKLTRIDCPNSLTTIQSSAFAGCTNLKNITLNENLKYLGGAAFNYCINLEKIYYNCIEVDDILSSTSSIFFQCGKNSAQGITLTIGKTVKRIPSYLFKCATWVSYSINITSIIFADGCVCESIGDYAFDGRINIQELTIPESIIEIGVNAFANCERLERLYYNATNALCHGEFLFGSISKIKVYIGENVTHIPNNIFNMGTTLTNRTPNIIEINFSKNSQCTHIGENAFLGTFITSIFIPLSVKTIDKNILFNCKDLTEINFDGSQHQWLEIDMDDIGITNVVVKCIDGDIFL